ncbi:hypothetical protein ACFPTY_03425 [Halomonas beimenensis]|nr:hypothetical protein [Halomonas beimenensis]
MASIIRSFSHNNDEVVVIDKETGTETLTSINDDRFTGWKAWSNHIEEILGRDDIERKMQGQVRQVENHGNVSSHIDISRYDLFWKLRHHHSLNPSAPETMLEGIDWGKLPKDIVHWCNQNGKVPINGDGTVDGIFSSSMKIEKELEENWHQYKYAKWDVIHCPSGGFISADCYDSRAIIPISDTTALAAVPKHKATKGTVEVKEDTVAAFNSLALEQCKNFCFKLKNS